MNTVFAYSAQCFDFPANEYKVCRAEMCVFRSCV